MTACDRCGYGEPGVHDLSGLELEVAQHFLAETYNGEGDDRRRSHPPAPVDLMLHEDPHYFLCQNAIRRARRLLAAFPGLAVLRAAAGEAVTVVQAAHDAEVARLQAAGYADPHRDPMLGNWLGGIGYAAKVLSGADPDSAQAAKRAGAS